MQRQYLALLPRVVIVAARQTGKSALIGMLADDRELFDLQARADYSQIAADPDLFSRLNPGPIAIDEARLLPALLPALRWPLMGGATRPGNICWPVPVRLN